MDLVTQQFMDYFSEYAFQLSCPSSNADGNDNTATGPSRMATNLSSFSIIQETPKRNSRGVTITNKCKSHKPSIPPKSTEIKFKIESIGTQPEEDDDPAQCPARTRPCWPRQIITWWKPSHPQEKPPYSYATLIAHAILTSRDGRLTLSGIYRWISENYPFYTLGLRGWQNSVRHNLSLKKCFTKIERRPTQANPGKGCYWTLVPGSEQEFIDNLTKAGGHSRKHHDIGLTADLSINHRQGSCYYANDILPPSNHSFTSSSSSSSFYSQTKLPHTNMLITRPEDFEKKKHRSSSNDHKTRSACHSTEKAPTATAAKVPRVRGSSMYTTFRMSNTTLEMMDARQDTNKSESYPKRRRIKRRKHRRHVEPGSYCESDYDSGVDVGNEHLSGHYQKRHKKTEPAEKEIHCDAGTDNAVVKSAAEFSWKDLIDIDLAEMPDLSSGYDLPLDHVLPMPATHPYPELPDYLDPTKTAQLFDEPCMSVWPMSGDTWQWNPNHMPPSYPTLLTASFDPEQTAETNGLEHDTCSGDKVEECLRELLNFQQQQQQPLSQDQTSSASKFPEPITINLNEDVMARYLHFEEDTDDEPGNFDDSGQIALDNMPSLSYQNFNLFPSHNDIFI
ncbi:uncharacterized protein BYT42DRAFT_588776 [Radiomyces spectabilis]|uniref:uncharacterized protein n=1 Tax=Radiomyces spectabilis TaxID=64574 RepID=UPI00221E4761|nr:uncharacterized protein BYT42DRAFT_588776 [Radiomyces spectabilis]KAI8366065.1 hypothetical protein BYT42DRAFT_588776 [Radiomyces spectabilis]